MNTVSLTNNAATPQRIVPREQEWVTNMRRDVAEALLELDFCLPYIPTPKDAQTAVATLNLAVKVKLGRTEEYLKTILPEKDIFLSILLPSAYLREDLNQLENQNTTYASYYHMINLQRPLMEMMRTKAVRLLSIICQRLAPDLKKEQVALAPVQQLSPVSRSEVVKYTHPYALDIFFKKELVETTSNGQKGPMIQSITSGLVVAVGDNWQGGPSQASYVSGGFSPKAGNAVVIYSPTDNCLYNYEHFYAVAVTPGMFVQPGDILGTMGNTGINARKPGHGLHVHLEIFSLDTLQHYSAEQLLDLIYPVALVKK